MPYPLAQLGAWFCLLSVKHFQTFYPGYNDVLTHLRDDECKVQYANYQHWVHGNDTYLDQLAPDDSTPANCSAEMNSFGWGLPDKDCSGYELVNCLLRSVPETTKSDMAAAGLVLGLMPVILAMAGSTTTETALLALRRPLLAAMLGLASPAVDPIRTFAYSDSLQILRRPLSFNKLPARSTKWSWIMCCIIQYGVAAAAICNLTFVGMDLTRKTTVGNDPNRDYQVLAWSLWAFGIHLFGTIAFMLRFRLQTRQGVNTSSSNPHWMARIKASIREHCRYEFIPCRRLPDDGRIVERSGKKKAGLFLVLSWLVSTSTIVHIVYGTLFFTNMLWMAGGDALLVLLRCLASVAACRMVLMYELYEMGRRTTVESDQGALPYHGESSQSLLQEAKTSSLLSVSESRPML